MRRQRHLYYILDSENRPVEADLLTWAKWFQESEEIRRVAYTSVTTEVDVSTVFLGTDHRFLGEGPPILFETMVFGGEHDQEQQRYVSWDDAKTGHDALVAKLKKLVKAKDKL